MTQSNLNKWCGAIPPSGMALLTLSPNNSLSSHNNSHKTELLLTIPHWPPIFLEPLGFREIEQMDLYAFIPASLTTALYWLCWYPADQPCLPALVLKVPKTNLTLTNLKPIPLSDPAHIEPGSRLAPPASFQQQETEAHNVWSPCFRCRRPIYLNLTNKYFSAVGDAALVYPSGFLLGMAG